MWTKASQLPYKQMTPVEMAHFLGYTHLYNILAPVIFHHVPAGTLALLQQNLHNLMCKNLEDLPEGAHLRLPELTVLTELEVPEIWFPLCSPQAKQSMVGYHNPSHRRITYSKFLLGLYDSTRRPRTSGRKLWDY